MKPILWTAAFVLVVAGLLIAWPAQQWLSGHMSADLRPVQVPAATPNTPLTPTQTPAAEDQEDDEDTSVNAQPPSKPVPTTPPPVASSAISLAQLSAHNTKTDCWVAYKGNVYDVTAWLPRHPGGVSSISRYCGTADAFAAAFVRQHGTRQDSRFKREATTVGEYAA